MSLGDYAMVGERHCNETKKKTCSIARAGCREVHSRDGDRGDKSSKSSTCNPPPMPSIDWVVLDAFDCCQLRWRKPRRMQQIARQMPATVRYLNGWWQRIPSRWDFAASSCCLHSLTFSICEDDWLARELGITYITSRRFSRSTYK